MTLNQWDSNKVMLRLSAAPYGNNVTLTQWSFLVLTYGHIQSSWPMICGANRASEQYDMFSAIHSRQLLLWNRTYPLFSLYSSVWTAVTNLNFLDPSGLVRPFAWLLFNYLSLCIDTSYLNVCMTQNTVLLHRETQRHIQQLCFEKMELMMLDFLHFVCLPYTPNEFKVLVFVCFTNLELLKLLLHL
jgi:hypothetical protein